MTLSQLSTRIFVFAGAVMLGGTATIVAPMAHAANGPYYQAELVKPVEATRTIMRGVPLKCEGNSCIASKASTSPKNMCISIAREFGEINAFRAGDREFGADDLAKCNGDKRAEAARQSNDRLAAN